MLLFASSCIILIKLTSAWQDIDKSRVRLKVMHPNAVLIEITPGVQGLPCMHTPSQGKPCTPASLYNRTHRTHRSLPSEKGEIEHPNLSLGTEASLLFALLDRRVRVVGFTRVDLTWTGNFHAGVFDHLLPMCDPSWKTT